MEVDEFTKLEEKINKMVNNLKSIKDENKLLKQKIEDLKKESSLKSRERTDIKKRITSLIGLIESIENEK